MSETDKISFLKKMLETAKNTNDTEKIKYYEEEIIEWEKKVGIEKIVLYIKFLEDAKKELEEENNDGKYNEDIKLLESEIVKFKSEKDNIYKMYNLSKDGATGNEELDKLYALNIRGNMSGVIGGRKRRKTRRKTRRGGKRRLYRVKAVKAWLKRTKRRRKKRKTKKKKKRRRRRRTRR